MKNRSYTGPVTSLTFVGNDLFAGHGSDLKIFTLVGSRFDLQVKKRIFERQRIQGINVRPFSNKDVSSEDAKVLLWGGKRFQIASVAQLKNQEYTIDVENEIPVPDWILHAIILSSEGQTTKVAMITAHNTILTYLHDSKISMSERFCFYPSPERCLLYSASIVEDTLSSTSGNITALAGTVFGEVLLWRLDTLNGNPNNKTQLSGRYLSHEGSVFGVSTSPDLEYAASCSDDRTIRLWDIKSQVAEINSQNCREMKDPVAVGWGHQARIWGVIFLKSEQGQIRLISFSEDLTAKIWSLRGPGLKKSLECVQTFRSLHSASGKNIWSMAVHASEEVFVTGGADNGIALWNLKRPDVGANIFPNSNTSITETAIELDDIAPTSVSLSKKKPIKSEPRKYIAFGSHSFIVSMSSGWLLHCDISLPEEQRWHKLGFWPKIGSSSALGAGKILVGENVYNISAVGDNEGNILFFEGDKTGKPLSSLEQREWVKVCDHRPADIMFSKNEDRKDASELYLGISTYKTDDNLRLLTLDMESERPIVKESLLLEPPETFPFSVILVCSLGNRRVCIAGSKHGALALYDISPHGTAEGSPAVKATKVWRHIHDDDTVNSLSLLRLSNDESEFEIESTGRSGSYKVHRISTSGQDGDGFCLIGINVIYPPAIPRLEGHTKILCTRTNTEHEILYGFRGRDFVLWNETLGIESTSIDCEGGNRSWDFAFGTGDNNKDEGLFVFTRAKKCYIIQFGEILHDPLIQVPFHGRELKALAVSPTTKHPYRIVATGAEDTVIRFWRTNPKTDDLVPLTLRKSHTTGIQDLAWTSCGGWLFSSGSIEEVYAWKVNYLPANRKGSDGASIGVVRQAIYETSADKLPDLRVCGLDVLTIYDDSGEAIGFLVGMVRSDSSIKIVFYEPFTMSFSTFVEGFYKTSCLLQIKFRVLKYGKTVMFTAGTDGFVTAWDLSEALAVYGITSNSGNLVGKPLSMKEPVELVQSNQIFSQSLHQNSIKTMFLLDWANDDLLLFTGGDDTAITISKIMFELEGSNDIRAQIASISKQRAHASAVTALVPLPDTGRQCLQFVSSGVDQQVKRWSVDSIEDILSARIEILEDIYVNIPDVASLALISDTGSKNQTLVVGGVGVEILDM